jgi:hypothetical protein
VDNLQLDNVRLRCEKEDMRAALMCNSVGRLTLDNFKFRRSAGAADPLVLDNVQKLQVQDSDLSLVQPRCTDVRFTSEDASGRFVAGGRYTVSVAVENGSEEGLGKVEVTVIEQTTTRWVWLRPNEKKDVVFRGLIAPAPGTHEAKAGNLSKSLIVEDQQ